MRQWFLVRGGWKTIASAVLAAVVTIAVLYVPTPFFLVAPGSVRDTSELVEIQGVACGEGRFMLTTISLSPASVGNVLFSLVDKSTTLRSSRDVIPDDMDWDEYVRQSRRMMAESQAAAKVAALSWLGYDARMSGEGVRVVSLMEDSPSQGLLEADDVIIVVDDVDVEFAEDLLSHLADLDPGTMVMVTVRRDDDIESFQINTGEHPVYPERSALRIMVETAGFSADIPMEITIDAEGISGPSAGLMFTLEIINQLDSSVDLTGGLSIAGTGTIDPRGSVGSVGGVYQKVIAAGNKGADVFFVPGANADEARSAGVDIEIVSVSVLDDAIEFLNGVL